VVTGIAEMLRELLALPEPVWDAYAFRAEPLIGKIGARQKEEFAAGARECGQKLARELLDRWQGSTPEECALALGAKVSSHPQPDGGSYMMFASFTEPDHIRIYQATVDKALAVARETGLPELAGADMRQVLVAHELYHYFECERPDLYTVRRLLRLWRLGPFENYSRVSSLGEIGAMAFTRELLSLPYSPYIYDVLFLYTENKRLARQLYETIMRLAEKKE